jgi:hypothetical protein
MAGNTRFVHIGICLQEVLFALLILLQECLGYCKQQTQLHSRLQLLALTMHITVLQMHVQCFWGDDIFLDRGFEG